MPKSQANQIRVHVERLNSSGQGVGRFEGITVFVDGALPGERVLASVVEKKSKYWRARLDSVDEVSPLRVNPPCPHFSDCGGCHVQHLSYAGQVEMKTMRVQDALVRLGGFPKNFQVEPCLAAPEPFHYRNKVQIQVRRGPRGAELGFFRPGSHEIVSIDRCDLHAAEGEAVRKAAQPLILESGVKPYDSQNSSGTLRNLIIRSSRATRECLIVLVTRSGQDQEVQRLAEKLIALPGVVGVVRNWNDSEGNTVLGRTTKTLLGKSEIIERMNGVDFKISGTAFFQVNTAQAERLFQKALELAELKPSETALDLYSGAGAVTLQAARFCRFVAGIEAVEAAVADGIENAKFNSINNVSFHLGDLERSAPLRSLAEKIARPDCVFLDPPRKGASSAVLRWLTEIRPSRIVYISCDPGTLARDLAQLRGQRFSIEKVIPVDMFPQTNHVESVALIKAQ